jgi:hypothetical protein
LGVTAAESCPWSPPCCSCPAAAAPPSITDISTRGDSGLGGAPNSPAVLLPRLLCPCRLLGGRVEFSAAAPALLLGLPPAPKLLLRRCMERPQRRRCAAASLLPSSPAAAGDDSASAGCMLLLLLCCGSPAGATEAPAYTAGALGVRAAAVPAAAVLPAPAGAAAAAASSSACTSDLMAARSVTSDLCSTDAAMVARRGGPQVVSVPSSSPASRYLHQQHQRRLTLSYSVCVPCCERRVCSLCT